eukprot:2614355-Rhodomonas_salina.1
MDTLDKFSQSSALQVQPVCAWRCVRSEDPSLRALFRVAEPDCAPSLQPFLESIVYQDVGLPVHGHRHVLSLLRRVACYMAYVDAPRPTHLDEHLTIDSSRSVAGGVSDSVEHVQVMQFDLNPFAPRRQLDVFKALRNLDRGDVLRRSWSQRSLWVKVIRQILDQHVSKHLRLEFGRGRRRSVGIHQRGWNQLVQFGLQRLRRSQVRDQLLLQGGIVFFRAQRELNQNIEFL